MTYTPNILKIKVKGGLTMQANISLIRGDTLPLSIDSISIQGTEEKYIPQEVRCNIKITSPVFRQNIKYLTDGLTRNILNFKLK